MFSSQNSQVSSDANYIEDVFSTYLYTGTGATQTITNGIDLSTYGGMIWTKDRNTARNNVVYDTTRGLSKRLVTNTTAAQTTATVFSTLTTTSYNADWPGTSANETNASGETYVSWTFRKQPKFFDIVTYTGNGSTKTISHNLGSTPGCIIVKRTASSSGWYVYHRSLAANNSMELQDIYAAGLTYNFASVTSTSFNVTSATDTNENNAAYVAYVFAHDAGGFGLTGSDNVISCGSYTGNGSTTGPVINLGYEPQWVMIKSSSAGSTENWYIFDSMRGMVNGSGNDQYLIPNLSNAEAGTILISPTATGFTLEDGNTPVNRTSTTYIYIAIRRGPMKVPTSGTSVFAPALGINASAGQVAFTSNFPTDLHIEGWRAGFAGQSPAASRLTGDYNYLRTSSTSAEQSDGGYRAFDSNVGLVTDTAYNFSNMVGWEFRRAPSFFDEVCYTGTGSARTVTHNLGVAPELIIVKSRSSGTLDWLVYSAPTGNANALLLNTTDSSFGSTSWGSTTPTASVFSTGATGGTNNSGATFVAYLFATCAGVSKVGSYTGNGSTQTINCSFTGGARFVLIKRTDSTGDWYVWDTARGIVTANDPHLSLNTTAAEVTTDDTIDTNSTGFVVNQVTATNVNVTSATYIFLAIA